MPSDDADDAVQDDVDHDGGMMMRIRMRIRMRMRRRRVVAYMNDS